MCLIGNVIRDTDRKQLFIDLCDRADDCHRGGSVSPPSSLVLLALSSVWGRREVALRPPYESACRQERGTARRASARLSPPRMPQPMQAAWPSHPPTQPRSTALAHLLRYSFVRAYAAQPIIASSLPLPFRGTGPSANSEESGGHNAAEAQPALILVEGASNVLAVHVAQQTVDGLRVGGVADEARYNSEVVHEREVVWQGAEEQFARHVHGVFVCPVVEVVSRRWYSHGIGWMLRQRVKVALRIHG